jgi:hypothetical protein
VGWRARPSIKLSQREKAEIRRLSRQLSAPFRLVVRARIVLLASQNVRTMEIVRRVGAPRQAVLRWITRFHAEGIAGLVDRPRPGRPRLHRTANSHVPVRTRAGRRRG